jgi:hypothetical protein
LEDTSDVEAVAPSTIILFSSSPAETTGTGAEAAGGAADSFGAFLGAAVFLTVVDAAEDAAAAAGVAVEVVGLEDAVRTMVLNGILVGVYCLEGHFFKPF